MEQENRCPQCGNELEQGGECPACLLRLGLSGAIPAMPSSEPEPLPLPRPEAPVRRWRPAWRPAWRAGWKWLAIVAVAGAIALFLQMLMPGGAQRASEPVVRFSVPAPEEAVVEDFSVSPDGRALAFTATGFDGITKLWSRRFDEPASQEVPGTEGASGPFWSPDSQHIAYFAEGKLKRIEVAGGTPLVLADAPLARGGSWGPNGVVLFTQRGQVVRMGAGGGAAAPVTQGPHLPQWPHFLPDGDHFLYYNGDPERGLFAGGLSQGDSSKIGDGEPAIFSDGRLIFTRDGALLSQPFDPYNLEFTGDPVPIRFAAAVRRGGSRAPAFSAGAGVLAFRNGDAPEKRVLMWMDRTGRILGQVGDPAEDSEFALSPDGSSVAFTRRTQGAAADLWVLNLVRGTPARLTFDGPGAASPLWSPDGKRIAYVASPRAARGESSIQWLKADGSGSPEPLAALPQGAVLNDWSSDGKFLLYTQRERDGRPALRMLALEGERKPNVILTGPSLLKQARLSPDARWLAYVSDEAGREDVYVQSFPPGKGKWMVSNEGGSRPAWRGDGRELYFVEGRTHGAQRLMSVAIQAGAVLEAGAPRPLGDLQGGELIQATRDGQRFLISMPMREHQPEPIQVVLNWTAETSR